MIYTKSIDNQKCYDVAVIGGGFSGFAAAYASAREGKKTILVERGACIGGVGTQGLVNQMLGIRTRYEDGYKTCIKGLCRELEERVLKDKEGIDFKTFDFKLSPIGWKYSLGLGFVFDNEYMRLTLERMLMEVGVEVLYYTDVIDVIKVDNTIKSVVAHNKSGLALISAKCFVDATGDGDIYTFSGEEYDFGDSEGGLAAASLELHVENVDSDELMDYMRRTGDVRFKALIAPLIEAGKWDYDYEIFISVLLTRPGVYMINTIRQVGIDGTSAESMSRGTIEGREENYKLLETMRAHFPGFKNAKVRQIASSIGIRETRRLKGMYTLTVDDVILSNRFDDSIAVSGYGWDMPNPKRPSDQPYQVVERRTRFTEIPYRTLLPRSTENLIVVGRCISVEREVLGVVRVMGPCVAMGEAAGIAASMVTEQGISFSEIDVELLKERIKARGGITSAIEIN